MKTKKLKTSIAFFGLLLTLGTASAVFTSCGEEDPGVPVTDISLNELSLELAIGVINESVTLVAQVSPDDATVTWSSDKPAIATVDANGIVTALATGTATITAKAGGKTVTCTVNVRSLKTITSFLIDMVNVAGGTFTMGATAEQGGDANSETELPTHSVTLSDYEIGKYEVTQAQWKLIMGSIPSTNEGDRLPVDEVSWTNVNKFISWLNIATGKQYRLPTEAEWEYAARGGASSEGFKYSGSNTIDDVAWYKDNSGTNSGTATHTVGTKNPNELGIYDMSGNVMEWCSDWATPYSREQQQAPTGPTSNRILRGGNAGSPAEQCRVSFRGGNKPDFRGVGYGFRLVLPQQ